MKTCAWNAHVHLWNVIMDDNRNMLSLLISSKIGVRLEIEMLESWRMEICNNQSGHFALRSSDDPNYGLSLLLNLALRDSMLELPAAWEAKRARRPAERRLLGTAVVWQ